MKITVYYYVRGKSLIARCPRTFGFRAFLGAMSRFQCISHIEVEEEGKTQIIRHHRRVLDWTKEMINKR